MRKTAEHHHYQTVLLQELQVLEMVQVTAKVFNITKTLAHSSNFVHSGLNKVTAFKAAAHGLASGAIQSLQGGKFKAGFFSGLSSAFDVGTKAFGSGAGGFIARTTAFS